MPVEPIAVCAGEILVDLIPTEVGTYREGLTLEVHFGGAPANVAVGLSKLGVPTAFIGAVGDDAFGEMLIRYLSEEGVFTGWLSVKKARTSLAFVIARPEGEREFFFYRAPWVRTADCLLEDRDIDWEAVKAAKVLHVSGVALSQPPLSETVLRLMEVLKRQGAHVSLDPNFRSDIWLGEIDRAKREFLRAAEYATLITLGFDELLPLLGTEDYRRATSFILEQKPDLEHVAVRLGSRGAYVVSREGEEALVEAFKVHVVDTTGAGDAWTAGFITFRLIEGRDLREAVLLANAVAAMKCTRRGATTAMPRRFELKEFLNARGTGVEV
ncbi:MAG: sugar kinase [Thermofilaceae archaeon]